MKLNLQAMDSRLELYLLPNYLTVLCRKSTNPLFVEYRAHSEEQQELVAVYYRRNCLYTFSRMSIKDGDVFTLRVGVGSKKKFKVEIVVSPEAIVQGLSDRPNLNKGAGMLFIFPNISKQSMWMIKMKFPLDIVWLDEYLNVVHITYGCEPCSNAQNCPSYSSIRRVKYAIEMKAGDADAYGFEKEKQLVLI